MTHKQAWEHLKCQIRARAEHAFFAQGDDPDSIYKLLLSSLDITLDQMEHFEKHIGPDLKLVISPTIND